MKEQALISVVIPAYNAERFIEQTIKSVVAQTYQNIEIIVVNDCSTDKTMEILEKLKKTEKRLLVETLKENSGVSAARNKGVELAKGEYVAFLDADDLWREDKIEKQLDLIKESKAVLCCTGYNFIDEASKKLTGEHNVLQIIELEDILRKNYINTSSAILRKDVIKENKMEGENIHEDYLAWLRILKEYGQAVGVNESLTSYRVLSGSRSSNKFKGIGKTYRVYRMFGLNIIKSMYYTCWYIINGIKKYSKIKEIK